MKNKIIGIIFALIIVAGIIITCFFGLNFSLTYEAHKELDVYIGKEFEDKDIYNITKEVVGNGEIIIQKVELYEDMACIKLKDISEEQLSNLNTKINEKYEIENKVEDIVVTSVSNARGRDLIKPYIKPVAISFAIIMVYIIVYCAIYARKGIEINIVKTIAQTVGIEVLVQTLYLSVLAITRLEVNRLTIPVAIALYIITTIGIMLKISKKCSKVKEEKKNNKK